MILNQTRIETPKQTFVPNNNSANSVPFISYIRKEKSKNVIILSSDEEDSEDEQQPQTNPLIQQEQTVSLTSSSRPNKQRKLEVGKSQNDPISLDDSDDDMAEIIEEKNANTEQKLHLNNIEPQTIASSIASSPMTQFEDYFDDGPPIDQETFHQNFLNFGQSEKEKKEELDVEKKIKIQKEKKEEIIDNVKDNVMTIDDQYDDSFSVLSELSETAYEQLSRMSVREDSVKDEDLPGTINITEPVS